MSKLKKTRIMPNDWKVPFKKKLSTSLKLEVMEVKHLILQKTYKQNSQHLKLKNLNHQKNLILLRTKLKPISRNQNQGNTKKQFKKLRRKWQSWNKICLKSSRKLRKMPQGEINKHNKLSHKEVTTQQANYKA